MEQLIGIIIIAVAFFTAGYLLARSPLIEDSKGSHSEQDNHKNPKRK